MLTQLQAMNGEISNNDMKKNLRKVRHMLSESVAILSLEAPGTREYFLFEAAQLAFAQTEQWGI